MINSAGSGVAVRAALFLALQPSGTCSTVRDIAAGTGLPEPYLAKIVRQLAAAGLVRAFRGPGGGVALVPDPAALTLWTVARSVDPSLETEWCIMGLQPCAHDRTCPLHDRCAPLRAAMRRLLQETTLASLTDGLRRRSRGAHVPWFQVPGSTRRPVQASAARPRQRPLGRPAKTRAAAR
jgi:Rrf2 family protein